MIFTAVLVIATSFAFYKWLNRDNGQQNDEDDNVAVESHEAKVARYNRCGMSEVRLVIRIWGWNFDILMRTR